MINKKYQEALDKYEKAKKSRIPSFKINLKIGICHYKLGNYEKALEFLEIAKFQGERRVTSQEIDKDGKRVQKFIPQVEIIEVAEKYIAKIKDIQSKKNSI